MYTTFLKRAIEASLQDMTKEGVSRKRRREPQQSSLRKQDEKFTSVQKRIEKAKKMVDTAIHLGEGETMVSN